MEKDINKDILENAPLGYAYHKIILNDKNEPIDYRFLKVNKEFENLTGLNKKDIINKTAREVIPDIQEGYDWISYYGDIALNDKVKEFEQYSKPLNKYYRIKVYSPEKLHFVTIFKDITPEIELAKSSRQFLEHGDQNINYQIITDKLLTISGAKYIAFNKFKENSKGFRTMAISGIDQNIQKGLNILGFNPVGREWKHDPRRAKIIAEQATTYFDKLHKLTGEVIPKQVIKIIEKVFNLGQTALVKITKDGKMLGDFTIMMPKSRTFKHQHLIESYAQQVGLFISKKQTERRLKESEERYRIVTEKNKDGIYILQDHKIVFANNILCRMVGHSKEELRLINFWKFLHPDDRPRIKKIAKARARGKDAPEKYEARGITKDGEILNLEFSVSPIKYKGRYAALGTVRDITERKRLQKELRKSEKKYRTLVENSKDAIVILQNNKFKYVNKAFGEIININSENIIGKQYDEIFNTSAVKKIRSIEKENKGIRFETSLNRNGNQINVEANTTIIEYNQEDAIFAAIRDITRQKKIMRRLKKEAEHTKALDKLIPICAGCNKIKDKDKENESWISPAEYISERLPDVEFTHGMCPECIKKWYPNLDIGKDEK